MINYKSFKLPGNSKLRVRADRIVATVSSGNGGTIDLYISGVTMPWHLSIDRAPSEIIDYVWERHSIENEEEGDNN